MEVPPLPSTFTPPPLDEAIPLELYERCLAPKPAEPVVQEEAQPTPSEGVFTKSCTTSGIYAISFAQGDKVRVDASSIVSNLTQEEGTLQRSVPV